MTMPNSASRSSDGSGSGRKTSRTSGTAQSLTAISASSSNSDLTDTAMLRTGISGSTAEQDLPEPSRGQYLFNPRLEVLQRMDAGHRNAQFTCTETFLQPAKNMFLLLCGTTGVPGSQPETLDTEVITGKLHGAGRH